MAISLFRPSRWLRSQRDTRLARHRELTQGHPPVACSTAEDQASRTHWIQRMATWDEAQWQAYSQPWADLLAGWLSDPVPDEAGLRDFRDHHAQAWWNARHDRPKDLVTPLSRLVWARLIHEPVSSDLLAMASLESPGFMAQAIVWAMRHPRPDLIQSLRSSYVLPAYAPLIMATQPTAAPGQFEAIWASERWHSNSSFLLGLMRTRLPHTDEVLATLSQEGRRLWAAGHWRGKSHVQDIWHASFFRVLTDPYLRQEREDTLPTWVKHFTWAEPEKIRDNLRDLWQLAEEEGTEIALARDLDGITAQIESIIPRRMWLDPTCWPEHALRWMPQTSHRHLTQEREADLARQTPVTSASRARPRHRS